MTGFVDLSSFTGFRVCQVEPGTIISDPLGKEPDVIVDDQTVAIRRGTMFVTERVFNLLRESVPEKRQ
ncbi:hypothetical protein [Rhizobium sp. NXC24]|uniref:hypothetical protein n=1 Tax=Rhizobium sp. NXC24 TaxID=2048897 RepID=UPI000CDF3086|nr:hypothetical protein [Rhizobium sp. NXC24]AVA20659.1 hypothetical protein NXC24_CH00992 [Rhizobium sp. NXC24]